MICISTYSVLPLLRYVGWYTKTLPIIHILSMFQPFMNVLSAFLLWQTCCKKHVRMKTNTRKKTIKMVFQFKIQMWTISKNMFKRIEAFEQMLYISWIMKITNQEVLRRVQLKKASCLLADIRKKKLGYFGHIIRHNTRQHALLEWKIEGRRSRGRPRTVWCFPTIEIPKNH